MPGFQRRFCPGNFAIMDSHERKNLIQDAAIIVLSIVIALNLAKTDVLIDVLASSRQLRWLGSFVSGIFFTSIFTTAPATVTLGEIAQNGSVWFTALFGGLGAIIGDLVIFRFVRDRIGRDISRLLEHRSGGRRLKNVFRFRFLRWLTFLAGGLIIASPLPDEIGISLLGFSKTSLRFFVLLSFVCNFVGILLVGLAARAFF